MGSLKQIWQCDGKDVVTTKYTVYDYNVFLDDPYLYNNFKNHIEVWKTTTELGKWVAENAYGQLEIHKQFDIHSYTEHYLVRANLTAEQITYYELKFK